MTEEGQAAETTQQFLEHLGKALAGKDGVDVALVEVLKTHLLRVDPAPDAVAQAKSAIVKLAGERASPAPKDDAHEQ